MRALIVWAHPDRESFSAHLRDRVTAGLDKGGHDYRLLDLYAEGFQPAMTREEWLLHRADAAEKPWTTAHSELLHWADMIVWVYPTWWSGPPAILKGWIDRVWTNGVAYIHTDQGLERGMLDNITRMEIVTTHGSSRLVNLIQGQVGRRMITRGLRALCNTRCRTRWTAMYRADTCKPAQLVSFADRVERVFSEL